MKRSTPLLPSATRRADRRIARARAALEACTPDERRSLFREIGNCACKDIATFAIRNPSMAAGALFGAFVVAVLETAPATKGKA